MKVRIKDNLQVRTENGNLFTLDSQKNKNADLGIISHAHADHIPSMVGESEYILSNVTHQLCRERVGNLGRTSHPNVKLLNAGHIPGSSAVLIESEESILYTGDVSIRDRLHLDGFKPISADYLIIESTYGHPRYNFDKQSILEKKVVDWISQADKAVCRGYSLGRAQEIELLARKAGKSDILVNKATRNINHVLNHSELDENFSTDVYQGNIPDGGILITSNKYQFENVSARADIESSVFTGWASDGRYESSDLVDEAFVLSDHADFRELLKIVEEVDPKKVYTVHGYRDTLADEISKRLQIDAISLKNKQSRLDEFGN